MSSRQAKELERQASQAALLHGHSESGGYFSAAAVREVCRMASWSLSILPHLAQTMWFRLSSQFARGTSSTSAPAATATLNVRYGPHSRNTVDVFPPAGFAADGRSGQQLRPCLVFVHGGAWAFGNKAMHSLLGKSLAHDVEHLIRRGDSGAKSQSQRCAVFVANYRLFPEARVDDMMADLDRFLSWLSACASHYGGDPNRIYVSGHSSGAHITSLCLIKRAIHDHEQSLQPKQRQRKPVSGKWNTHAWQLKQIRGFVGLSGPYHIADHYIHESKRGVAQVSPMKPCMNGPDNFDDNSPTVLAERHAEAIRVWLGHVDFHLVHGTNDPTVPWSSSHKFSVFLRRAGLVTQTRFVPLDDCGHTEVALPSDTKQQQHWFDATVRYFHESVHVEERRRLQRQNSKQPRSGKNKNRHRVPLHRELQHLVDEVGLLSTRWEHHRSTFVAHQRASTALLSRLSAELDDSLCKE
eukprot:TRINITY_DN65800_c7_g11_i1.p1 TRINITY_DN65800_c7_g11~~TRINITY_DN65800_c7_g11_i1.p1  ORF type:complete len:467 (-),score=142.99 TRINITY_DN65800_c7_g11_i1:133-1533(-)